MRDGVIGIELKGLRSVAPRAERDNPMPFLMPEGAWENAAKRLADKRDAAGRFLLRQRREEMGVTIHRCGADEDGVQWGLCSVIADGRQVNRCVEVVVDAGACGKAVIMAAQT